MERYVKISFGEEGGSGILTTIRGMSRSEVLGAMELVKYDILSGKYNRCPEKRPVKPEKTRRG